MRYILTTMWKIELFPCSIKKVRTNIGIDSPCVTCRGCYEWLIFLTKIKKKDLSSSRKKQGVA